MRKTLASTGQTEIKMTREKGIKIQETDIQTITTEQRDRQADRHS